MTDQRKKTVPKNSIFIIIKFDSKEQVVDMLQDLDYQEAYSRITNIGLVKGGTCEYFKSFTT